MSFLIIASSPKWRWTSLTQFLTHQECVALQLQCRSFNAALRSSPCIVNLAFNGCSRPGPLLLAASSHPLVAASTERISFEFCNSLQNVDLTPLDRFPNLTHINLNACRNLTDAGVELVSEKCHSLRRLELYWDVVLSDISITALLSASFPPLLTHLNLSGLKHVTDATLAPLLLRCSSLTFLDLTRCEGMHDESMRAIGTSCHALTTLLMYATPNVTDVGFESMMHGLTSLTHLDITGMKLITDRSVVAIAQHCSKLRTLLLMWVTPLTDASLIAIGSSTMSDLRILSMHGNNNITALGIESMAKVCQSLEQIDINGCSKIGVYRNNLAELKRIMPKINKLIQM